MKKINIISSFLIPAVSASASVGATYETAPMRSDLVFRIPKTELAEISEKKIADYLNANGIGADHGTEILVHEENDHWDFECFNCIVSERGFNDLGPLPVNDDNGPDRSKHRNE